MTRTLLFIGAFAAVSTASAQNTCATAQVITAGIYSVAGIDGPEMPNPICAPNGTDNVTASEWYAYTAPADLALTISTQLSNTDTRFHVYTGSCGALVCVGGDDDSGTPQLTSVATLNVTAGVTYRIAFDNRWSAAGFLFQITENPVLESPLSFTQVYLTGTGVVQCVVDMDGDMLDDAVSVNGGTVVISRQLAGGGFETVGVAAPGAVHSPSWSIAAGDLDDNGYTDLLYGGGSGCSIMMANDEGTFFNAINPGQYIFSQRTNMVDINNDGNLDVFVCHDVAPNVYYYHNGAGAFEYHQGGLGDNGGNYGSIWTDFDNDHDVDMFIAKCGSSPPDVLCRNNGDGTFTNVAAELGLADFHQSWSSAWGDFDNDADMDILIGASSGGPHKLMLNSGTGTFTDISVGSGITAGQSIEWTTHDFNNDGYLDVLGGGAMMINNGDMTFTTATNLAYNGPVGDLNNDGFLDIVNYTTCNMNNGNDNNYLKVYPVGTISNKNGIGARITITSPLGTQIRDVRSGDGFEFMSTITAHFGLGDDTEVYELEIHWPSGIVQTVTNPPINGILEVIEGVNTEVGEEVRATALTIYPNPAQDVLNIGATRNLNNSRVAVMDLAGKLVLSGIVHNGQLDVSTLTSGTYLLQVHGNGSTLQGKFTKR